MSLEKTNKLIDDIIEKRKEILRNKIQRYPARTFRASNIHECDRYMVHSILDWDKTTLHDEGLQALFDAGNKEEQNVKIRIQEAGFTIIHQQTPFEIRNRAGEVICTGHIDGKILYEGETIPWEIKSMDMNIFRGIKSLQDFQKKAHLRKYLRQMQLYLYGNNEEAGFFTLSDFRSEKHLPVVLDLGECEQILQKLERCWEHVKAKTYPDRITYNPSLCDRCGFAHVCLQDIEHKGAQFIDNIELEALLDRRAEVKPFRDEYDELDEQVKDTFKGVAEAFVGKKWQIIGKEMRQNRLDTKAIPDEIKSQYSKETVIWKTSIVEVK